MFEEQGMAWRDYLNGTQLEVDVGIRRRPKDEEGFSLEIPSEFPDFPLEMEILQELEGK